MPDDSPTQPRFGTNISLDAFQQFGDIRVTLVAELDRRTIQFEELVRLEPGTVLTLTRPAGENIDVLVGDVLMGSGEILVVDGTLVIRVADLRDKQPVTPRVIETFDEDSAAA